MKPHILYEDQDIIVCLKPAGIPTQTSRPGLPDMVSILKNHIYQNSAHKKQPYLDSSNSSVKRSPLYRIPFSKSFVA